MHWNFEIHTLGELYVALCAPKIDDKCYTLIFEILMETVANDIIMCALSFSLRSTFVFHEAQHAPGLIVNLYLVAFTVSQKLGGSPKFGAQSDSQQMRFSMSLGTWGIPKAYERMLWRCMPPGMIHQHCYYCLVYRANQCCQWDDPHRQAHGQSAFRLALPIRTYTPKTET